MKKISPLFFILFMCFSFWSEMVFAEDFKITGQVNYTTDKIPAAGVSVTFVSSNGVSQKSMTDVNGEYEIVFDISSGEVLTATGVVTDFCTEESVEVIVDSRKGLKVSADFHICTFIVFPPTETSCKADFEYLKPEPKSLTYNFADISYIETDSFTRSWDFGDGSRGSDQQTVSHTFQAEGYYEVSLKVEVENCVSEVKELFLVYRDTCDCPTELEPVCAKNVDGDIKPFQNECYAFCEGYGSGDLVDCDFDCGCTTENSPVCMEIELGYQVEFPNICLAYCAGYDSSYLVTCDTIVCPSCPKYWEPVCVLANGGDTLAFRNLCYAECHGFSVNDLIDCESEVPFDDCGIDFFYMQTSPDLFEVTFETILSRGVITSYFWDFGDGNTSNKDKPVHTYKSGGIYVVTLEVEFSEGCVGIVSNEVFVGGEGVISNPPECQAFFWFKQKEDKNTFYFTNMSLGNGLMYYWDFGDGITSTRVDPTHTYATPGTYLVTLDVDDGHCFSSYSMFVSTDPEGGYIDECSALFLPAVNSENLEVAFINLSSSDVIKTKWDFGDGQTSDAAFPVHTYAEKGIYDVVLTIETAKGCTNSFSMIINLEDMEFVGNPKFQTTGIKDQKVISSIRLFPNPVQEQLNVFVSAEEAGEGELAIVDLSGRVLVYQTQVFIRGENYIQLNLNELPEGMFFSRITLKEQVVSMKFVK